MGVGLSKTATAKPNSQQPLTSPICQKEAPSMSASQTDIDDKSSREATSRIKALRSFFFRHPKTPFEQKSPEEFLSTEDALRPDSSPVTATESQSDVELLTDGDKCRCAGSEVSTQDESVCSTSSESTEATDAVLNDVKEGVNELMEPEEALLEPTRSLSTGGPGDFEHDASPFPACSSAEGVSASSISLMKGKTAELRDKNGSEVHIRKSASSEVLRDSSTDVVKTTLPDCPKDTRYNGLPKHQAPAATVADLSSAPATQSPREHRYERKSRPTDEQPKEVASPFESPQGVRWHVDAAMDPAAERANEVGRAFSVHNQGGRPRKRPADEGPPCRKKPRL